MEISPVYYAQNCAVSLSVLGLAFFGFRRICDRRQISHRIFSWVFLPIFLNILLEPALGLLSGRPGLLNGVLVRMTVVLCFTLQPVPEALWIAYLYTSVRRGAKLDGFQWLVLSLPFLANLALALASLSYGLTFSIDANNAYHRGPYYHLMVALCYSYLIYYLCYALANRKRMLHHEFAVFFLGVLPTVLAGIVQRMFWGVMVIWQAAAFTMLVFYLNILIYQANTDSLTSLANRRRFDNQLEAAFGPEGHRAPTALILIDIDNFKSINDLYGHVMGDRALEAVGGALRRSARKCDLVARIGGDEFAMLAEVREPRDMERIAERVRENLRSLNQRSMFPFAIDSSIGYGSCDEREGLTPTTFLNLIDNRMYDEKRVNHRMQGEPAQTGVQLLKI